MHIGTHARRQERVLLFARQNASAAHMRGPACTRLRRNAKRGRTYTNRIRHLTLAYSHGTVEEGLLRAEEHSHKPFFQYARSCIALAAHSDFRASQNASSRRQMA
eukprot:638646-Pleurochrysis_carterae.AAC.1